jgi:hypothetical protein
VTDETEFYSGDFTSSLNGFNQGGVGAPLTGTTPVALAAAGDGVFVGPHGRIEVTGTKVNGAVLSGNARYGLNIRGSADVKNVHITGNTSHGVYVNVDTSQVDITPDLLCAEGAMFGGGHGDTFASTLDAVEIDGNGTGPNKGDGIRIDRTTNCEDGFDEDFSLPFEDAYQQGMYDVRGDSETGFSDPAIAGSPEGFLTGLSVLGPRYLGSPAFGPFGAGTGPLDFAPSDSGFGLEGTDPLGGPSANGTAGNGDPIIVTGDYASGVPVNEGWIPERQQPVQNQPSPTSGTIPVLSNFAVPQLTPGGFFPTFGGSDADNDNSWYSLVHDQNLTAAEVTEFHKTGVIHCRAEVGNLQKSGPHSVAGFTLHGDRPQTDVSTTLIHDNAGNGVTAGTKSLIPSAAGSAPNVNSTNAQLGHICALIGTADIYKNQTGIQVAQPLRPGKANMDLWVVDSGTDYADDVLHTGKDNIGGQACLDQYNLHFWNGDDVMGESGTLGPNTIKCAHPVCHIPSTGLNCVGPHNNLITCPSATLYTESGAPNASLSSASLPECLFYPEFVTAVRVNSNNVYSNALYGMLIYPSYVGQPSPNYSDPIDPQSSGTMGNSLLVGDTAIATFIGNRFHGNGQQQIEFDGGIQGDNGKRLDGWPFNIDALNGACTNGVNAFFCYRNRGSVGPDTFALHASNHAVLLVNHVGFAGGNTNNEDFEYDTFSLITALNKCTATSTCP